MDSEIIRRKVKQLEGKHITTMRGAVFHVYRVDDNAIFYDPLSTRSPGAHWTWRSTIISLSDEIQTGRRSPPEALADIETLCEELGIKGEEQNQSYLFAILCAVGVIRHPTAGKVTEAT